MANYIIPLFLFPYLGSILGTENFGKIMFAQAIVAYFVLFTDFGFNVSSTKEIADAMGDKMKISSTFWNTMLAKMLLCLISLIVFSIIVYCFDRFQEDYILFLISFINVLASVLFPLWLFQGLEKLGLIVIINTIPRIIMCFVTIFLVKSSNDYNLALLIQVVANLVSAILSLFLVFRLKLIFFVRPSFNRAKVEVYNGWHIFASSLSSNLYTTTNTVILGLLVSNSAVGIYSAADKIVRAIIGLFSSINQVVFPRVNVYFNESKGKCFEFIKQIAFLVAILCFFVGGMLFFLSDEIIGLMFKNGEFAESSSLLRFSLFLPLFSVVNGILAVNFFITFGYKRELLRIVFSGSLFSLIAISPFVLLFREVGAIACATITEVFIFGLFLFFIKKQTINYYE